MKALLILSGWFVRNLGIVVAATFLTGVPSWAEETNADQPQNPGRRGVSFGVPTADKNPFTAGKWTLVSYGSAAVGKTSRRVYAGHLGLGYYMIDSVSINLEGAGYFIDQTNDTGAGAVGLLPRWHYLQGDNWSVYVDGGAGIIYSDKRMGDSGTHFNFTLEAGLGMTYSLSERIMPITGFRWFHVSNARIKGEERNVGFDSPMFYLGIMMPF